MMQYAHLYLGLFIWVYMGYVWIIHHDTHGGKPENRGTPSHHPYVRIGFCLLPSGNLT